MQSNNPVLSKYEKTDKSGFAYNEGVSAYTQAAAGGAGAADTNAAFQEITAASGARLTINDVIIKSFAVFAVTVIFAMIGWNVIDAMPWLLFVGLIGGLALGFVNAPATPQQVIGRTAGLHVAVSEYEKRRDLLCRGLEEAGYRFFKPQGAFYLFPESPAEDEIPFVRELMKEGVLVVPGTGFGRSGYFRIAFCVKEKVIRDALPVFARVLRRYL